ncbi:MAG: circadian clock protein KaiC [Candidatus Altiarchaeales archaeon]|nr:MAG: circadian clock protein KaiC [Candidatus Altiarchaeales archaeon]RLI93691.1 MAG: circadian clock protein KaiC [Candidatus Altiarchaeales archaeon]RLI94694.1 MAG: circadian clock protein KaiC [Candidatus Altiarchaeales archaeon]HDO82679.1 circadian clock protein KaiC [Candidatus Altiarchaeales archaeon]HEX55328.1 circadian clock protein KaiC [Candidatus Altiarchaeales archaeon]
MVELIKTGIPELDEILNGGIPRGNSVLLAGSCGTGKTILSEQFLFTGARENDEVGIYISLSEPRDKILSNLEPFKFYDSRLVEEEKIKIVDITQDARLINLEPLTVNGIISMIGSIIRDSGAQRVVIDSLTAICNSLGNERNIREFIFELGLQLGYLDCTTIFISEIQPMKFQYSVYGVEEFIADGVILLSEFEDKGDLIRTLQVVKMRGVKHARNKHILEITEEGVKLKPMFEL